MMFKRGALDKSKEGCTDLLQNVSHLLKSGDKDMVDILKFKYVFCVGYQILRGMEFSR